jgi:hypothetical protein
MQREYFHPSEFFKGTKHLDSAIHCHAIASGSLLLLQEEKSGFFLALPSVELVTPNRSTIWVCVSELASNSSIASLSLCVGSSLAKGRDSSSGSLEGVFRSERTLTYEINNRSTLFKS